MAGVYIDFILSSIYQFITSLYILAYSSIHHSKALIKNIFSKQHVFLGSLQRGSGEVEPPDPPGDRGDQIGATF